MAYELIGWIEFVLIYLYATNLVAKTFGTKRQIGYRKSIYWCILLTPIIGLIVTLSSPKLTDKIAS